jgi:outer membrane protein OmpA-like peptidoglycan-associated protein
LAIVSLLTLAFFRIELALLQNNIDTLPPEPGIVLSRTEINNGKIHLRLLRDPAAPSAREWLRRYGVETDDVSISESSFVSLHNAVIETKLLNLISAYPSLSIAREEASNLRLSGSISAAQYSLLLQKVNAIPGISQLNINANNITITPVATDNSATLSAALAKQIASEVSGITLNFKKNQNTLAVSEMEKLNRLTLLLTQLQDVAHQINLSVAVFIMGASDRSGTTAKNKTLSRARADNVKNLLVSNGVDESLLLPMGLGSLPLNENAMGRTVFLNVLISEAKTTEDKNP